MFYAIYLAVMAIVLLFGAVTRISLVPALSISIDFGNIINFLDILGLVVLLAVILTAVILTKSIRPMKDAFVFMFRKRDYPIAQLEDCLLAVKTAVLAAFAGGGAMFLMAMINMLKSMDLEGGASRLGMDMSLGLLSLLYAVVAAFILLPLYVALKRDLTQKREVENGRHVVVRTKHKKAG